MKKILSMLLVFIVLPLTVWGTSPQYTKVDSIKVMQLLNSANKQPKGMNIIIYLARQLKGIPYVGQTLEGNTSERLIVNLRQLDCTTYVENVLALYLCHKNQQNSFEDYCRYLRLIRYQQGEVSYTKRLHYFSLWIEDNTQMGFVKELQTPTPPFVRWQTLQTSYMSTYPQKYPMLVKHPEWISDIVSMERQTNGKRYRFIPKGNIRNTKLFRNTIHNGDIIAITTSKNGLDTSHIGIAIWQKDGLHLLNASQIHKKVVEEPMTLYQYMQRHPSQTGIRVVRIHA